jgi:hypothetical protein
MSHSNTFGPAGQPAGRLVRCVKLGRELPGLPAKPFPNDLGQRLYDEVSMEAWGLWMVSEDADQREPAEAVES